MKVLIVNGDDFGMTAAATRGVARACAEGVLTSASLVTNMAASELAVRTARGTPALRVGVHLNFLRGRPLSPPRQVASLLSRDGTFRPSLRHWVTGLLLRQVRLGEVLLEARAQVRRAVELGVRPSHLDAERHLHLLPGLAEVVRRVAREFGIPRVRRAPCYAGAPWKTALLRHVAIRHEQACATTPRSIVPSAPTAAGYQQAIAALPEGSTELICHPAEADAPGDRDDVADGFFCSPARAAELQALTDPALRRRIADAGILLTTFDRLPAPLGAPR